MTPARTTSSSKLKATHRRPSTPAPALRSAPPGPPRPAPETAAQRAARLREEYQAAMAAVDAEIKAEQERAARAKRNDEVMSMLQEAGLTVVDLDKFEALQMAAAKRRIREQEDAPPAGEAADRDATEVILNQILALVDTLGVIGKWEIREHGILNTQGNPLHGNPAERLLQKLVARKLLVCRSDSSPRTLGDRHYKARTRMIYARTQEALDKFQGVRRDGVGSA
jgi:hypothetical protein